MKFYLPEIFWHGNREALMSVDAQRVIETDSLYRVASASMATPEIRLWDLDLRKDRPKLEFVAEVGNSVHESGVNVIRYNSDGKYLASGGIDRLVVIWERNDSQAPDIFANTDENAPVNKENWCVKKRLRYHVGDVCELCWSPDSVYVASVAMDKTLVIWNVQTGSKVKELTPDYHRLFLNGLSWDPRNMYLTAQGVDRCFYVYDIRNPKTCHCIGKVDKVSLPGGDSVTRLYHDDTLMTFNRRLEFSPDGELLITPAGCLEVGNESVYVSYIFTRSDLFAPALVLPTGGKASLVTRWCPQMFHLIDGVPSNIDLPYRMIVAIVCQDSVIIYDTQHDQPIFNISAIHYLSLTDCAWSPDGKMLMLCSQDGYASFLIFKEGELGVPYSDPPLPVLPSPPPLKSKKEAALKPAKEVADNCPKVDRKKSLNQKRSLILQMESAKNLKKLKNEENKEEAQNNLPPSSPGKADDVEQSPLTNTKPRKPMKITKNDINKFFKPKNIAAENDDDVILIEIPSQDAKCGLSPTNPETNTDHLPITPKPRRVNFTTISSNSTLQMKESETSKKIDKANEILDSPINQSQSPAKTPRRVQFTTIS